MTKETEDEKIERVKQIIIEAIEKKPKQHCFEMTEEITEDKQMVQIGG